MTGRPPTLQLAAVGAVAAAGFVGGAVAGPLVGIMLVAAPVGALVLWRQDPAWTFSLGLAAYIFTGHADLIGFPVDPARLLLLFGFVRLAVDGVASRPMTAAESRRERWQEWWIWAALAYFVGSAFASETLLDRESLFYLFDQYGLVPFGLFLVAGRVFGTREQRLVLLGTLLATSAYVTVIGLMEGAGLLGSVYPRYIADPSVGIHFGRARGPFVAAVPMGLALTTGTILGLAWLHETRSRLARAAALALVIGASLALLFTLTRGAWLAGIVAVLVCLALLPRFRPLIPVAAGLATLGLVGFLTIAPGVDEKVSSRTEDLNPVWERQNTLAAALRAVQDRPALGLGWGRWVQVGSRYLEQPDDIPLRGEGVIVHNVPLLTIAELGLVGAALWFGAFAACILLPLARRGPPEFVVWRAMTAALFVGVAVSGEFAPQIGPYAMVVLWTFGGILARGSFDADGDDQDAGARRGRPGIGAARAGVQERVVRS